MHVRSSAQCPHIMQVSSEGDVEAFDRCKDLPQIYAEGSPPGLSFCRYWECFGHWHLVLEKLDPNVMQPSYGGRPCVDFTMSSRRWPKLTPQI